MDDSAGLDSLGPAEKGKIVRLRQAAEMLPGKPDNGLYGWHYWSLLCFR